MPVEEGCLAALILARMSQGRPLVRRLLSLTGFDAQCAVMQ
jgi:hypothetical protein